MTSSASGVGGKVYLKGMAPCAGFPHPYVMTQVCRIIPFLLDPRWPQYEKKLPQFEGKAEFCGTHYCCEEGKLTGEWCPDVPRMLENWGISSAANTIDACNNAKSDVLQKVRVAALYSRAYGIAGILPS